MDQALVTFPVRDVKSSSLLPIAAYLSHLNDEGKNQSILELISNMKLLSRYCSLLSWQYIDLITVEVPFCWLYNTKSNPTGMLISTHSAAKNTHMIYPVEPHTISSVMM